MVKPPDVEHQVLLKERSSSNIEAVEAVESSRL